MISTDRLQCLLVELLKWYDALIQNALDQQQSVVESQP